MLRRCNGFKNINSKIVEYHLGARNDSSNEQ